MASTTSLPVLSVLRLCTYWLASSALLLLVMAQSASRSCSLEIQNTQDSHTVKDPEASKNALPVVVCHTWDNEHAG